MLLQAAVSNMQIEFLDGVKGDDISEKAIPLDDTGEHLGPANLGSWRAHMNVIHEYVQLYTFAHLLRRDICSSG